MNEARPSEDELASRRRECVSALPTRQWRHKKSGKSYFVVDVVILTEPSARLAFVYHPMDPGGHQTPFVRDRGVFLEKFEPEKSGSKEKSS
jgi:hypothetical protein